MSKAAAATTEDDELEESTTGEAAPEPEPAEAAESKSSDFEEGEPGDPLPSPTLKTAEACAGDLVRCLRDQLAKVPKPWGAMSHVEQDQFLLAVRNDVRDVIGRLVRSVAAEGFEAMAGTVESVTFKGGVKATIKAAVKSPEAHALADAEGQRVMVVVSDPELYMGGLHDIEADEDQADLFPGEELAGPGISAAELEATDELLGEPQAGDVVEIDGEVGVLTEPGDGEGAKPNEAPAQASSDSAPDKRPPEGVTVTYAGESRRIEKGRHSEEDRQLLWNVLIDAGAETLEWDEVRAWTDREVLEAAKWAGAKQAQAELGDKGRRAVIAMPDHLERYFEGHRRPAE